MLIAAFTFLMTFAIILGAYWLLEARPARASSARLRARLGGAPVPQGAPVVVTKSAVGAVADGGHVAALQAHFARVMRESGIDNAPRLFARTFLAGGILCVLMAVVGVHLGLVAIVGAAVPFLPLLWLRYRRQRRLRAIEETFPQAIELL